MSYLLTLAPMYLNKNHNRLVPPTSQDGYYSKFKSIMYSQGCGENGTIVHCWKCKMMLPLW